MAQNVILQGCDLERSRSSVSVRKFVKFHQNLIASFIVTAEQLLT